MTAKRFPDRDEIVAVRDEAKLLGSRTESRESRRLAGRVLARRGLGKLVFLDLVDCSGRMQLLCEVDRTGPLDVALGDVVGVTGAPMKTRRGEPSLAVEELELLGKNRSPLPDTFHGMTDVEARYRRRHLDLLMNEDSRAAVVLHAQVLASVRRYLDEEGFVEVETPILQPRYGGAFAEPFVTRYNALDADYYLRIASELYLERLIVGASKGSTRSARTFATRGSPTSTTRSSPCSSGTRRTPTTRTRWRGWSNSSLGSPTTFCTRRRSPFAGTRPIWPRGGA